MEANMKHKQENLWCRSAYPRPGWVWLTVIGWVVFVSSFVIIAGASMMSVLAPPSGGHLDKLLHALAYAVLTGGLLFAWSQRSLKIVFVFAFLFGAIVEVMQHNFATGRTGSIADAAANGAGILLVIVSWIVIYPYVRRYLATRDL